MGRNGRSSGGGGSGGGSAGRTGSFGNGPQGHARRTGSFGGGSGSGRSSGGSSSGGGFGGFDFGGSSGRSSGPGGSRRTGGIPPSGGFGGPVFPPGGGRGPVIPPPVIPPPVGGYGRVRSRGGMPRAGCATAIVTLIVVALLVVMAMVVSGGVSNSGAADREITESSVARTKLEGTTYQNEVYDELGWLNPTQVANGIREFYEETGVQPAIYLENRPDLIGNPEAQKKEAERLAEELGLSDSTFLYAYFDNNGEDGDWAVWTGGAAGTVMDDEALNIFEDYLTQNWFSDKDEDDVFIDTFNSTGKRIMSRTTNANDVAIWIWIALGVIAAGVAVYVIMKTRRKHEAERAAETERILKTDIKDLDDPLLDKYSDNKK